MSTGSLLPLNRPGRLIKKVRGYLADMQAFLADTPGAVTVLLDALPYADTALILKMLPLLGYAGKDRAQWPLFHLILEASKDEPVSRLAAVQLGLAASLSQDSSALKAALIKNLNHPEPSIRSSCALALGWEGNWPAVKTLIEHLPDPDRDVQAAVVAALSSVGDARVFNLLTAHLEKGMPEERRSILLNLWRFAEQIPHVEAVYIRYMQTISSELRLDALTALAMIPLSTTILDAYRRLLVDADHRIRRQVLENLSITDPANYAPLKDMLRPLLTDKDAKVRQTAIRLLAMR